MTDTSVESIYDDGAYLRANPGWHVEDSIWKAKKVALLLDSNHITPTSIVDVGCGVGRVLSELRSVWPTAQLSGWDTSTDVAKFWPSATTDNLQLSLGDFRKDRARYDVALLLDVFEHIPDYMGFLRDVSTLADRFVFHIPLEMNLSSVARKRYLHSRESVGHLHYFSAESAVATLVDTGYRVLDSRFTSGTKDLASAQRRVTHVVNILRSGLERVGPGFASTLVGGYSLLVLAEPARSS